MTKNKINALPRSVIGTGFDLRLINTKPIISAARQVLTVKQIPSKTSRELNQYDKSTT